jgi:hypothetical protein
MKINKKICEKCLKLNQKYSGAMAIDGSSVICPGSVSWGPFRNLYKQPPYEFGKDELPEHCPYVTEHVVSC